MSIATAEQFEENEQYDKAYEEYKKLYSNKSSNVDLLQRLGHVAIILNKRDEAEEYYRKILEIDATSVLAYEQLMDIYIHSDRYKYYISRGNLHVVQQELSHAVSDFKKALEKAQEVDEINSTRFVLANLYCQLGKNHQAIDEFLRILDSQAVNEVVYLKLAEIYVKEDSVSSAVQILERARENGFDTVNIKENLAQLYLRCDEPQKARELTGDKLVMVKSLLEEGENASALKILEEVKDNNKKNPQYHSLFAQYYFNEKNWENALSSVDEFDKFQKNSPLTFQMRALIFEEQGKDFDSHINWAKYNLLRGERDVALNEYFSAFQVNDEDGDLIRRIAELLEEVGDKTQAGEFWERLARLEPTNKKALEKMADFKDSIGDYASEADYLEKLVSVDKRNSAAIKKLAQIYEKNKNKLKAIEYYNKFVSISPADDEVQKVREKIKKLESSDYAEEEGLLDKIMRFFNKG